MEWQVKACINGELKSKNQSWKEMCQSIGSETVVGLYFLLYIFYNLLREYVLQKSNQCWSLNPLTLIPSMIKKGWDGKREKKVYINPYPIIIKPASLLVLSKSDSPSWQHIKITHRGKILTLWEIKAAAETS